MIFFGLLFLICIWLGRKERVRQPLEGEKITVEDVGILLQALDVPEQDLTFLHDRNDDRGNEGNAKDQPEHEYLTYGQYIKIRDMLSKGELNLPSYEDRYAEDQLMLKNDWYAAYRLMLAHLDTESSVWETTIFVLKVDQDTNTVYTESGGMQDPYHYCSSAFEQNALQRMKVYIKGTQLLTLVELLTEEYKLDNVWVMESTEGILECFYHQISFLASAQQPVERERVADLTFLDGVIIDAREKSEKIHGKLLRMTEDEMEIDGCGTYRIAEEMEVYKLYGNLETKARSDLKIGYADTDFVIYKGRICAALISEKEAADRIRVLLKNTANNSNYHNKVELAVDGETIQIQEDDLKVGERRRYQCAALTDKVLLYMEENSREDIAYRGIIECCRTADGMILINELPLEEYLYAVVPSEMPASYPLEALKAQAVCARTYAYRHILHAGLPEMGAHVDDTTSYQVYHSSSENAASTTAVKETDGVLLIYQGEPAQNYYYSTSCGAGTDAGIWQTAGTEDISYLQAVRLKQSDDTSADELSDDLRDEENFRRFITSKGETDLEREEPWYRWSYTVEALDAEAMLKRIQSRYKAKPESVLTKAEGDYFVSEPIEKMGAIRNISVIKRGAGGVAEELLIETDEGIYKILSEYNIRSVLCDSASEVIRQDDSKITPKTLLPSGFFILETGKKEGSVVGYTLIGGGYGHGVGMSQNGARALGKDGASYRTILEFFFSGCELGNPDQIYM